MRTVLLSISLFLLFTIPASAQSFGCIDTLLIQAGPPCSHADYMPVCGCDNITYRNGCFSYYNGVTSTIAGPCEAVDFDFYPNPVANNLTITIFTREEQAILNIYIYDLNGNLYYYDNFQTFTSVGVPHILNLDVGYWERGIYMIMMQAGDYFTLKKFVKHTIE